MPKQPTARDRRAATKRRTTSYLPWPTAKGLIKDLEKDGRYNVALMISAGIHMGLRISDTLRLTWGQLRKKRLEIIAQKTGKVRRIPIHPDLAALRDRYLAAKFDERKQPADAAFVFTSTRGETKGKPISIQAANKRLAAALERHKIETANPSTHTLRKTFARRVWEQKGANEAALVLLSEILNHKSLAVTRRYIGITTDEIAAAYTDL